MKDIWKMLLSALLISQFCPQANSMEFEIEMEDEISVKYKKKKQQIWVKFASYDYNERDDVGYVDEFDGILKTIAGKSIGLNSSSFAVLGIYCVKLFSNYSYSFSHKLICEFKAEPLFEREKPINKYNEGPVIFNSRSVMSGEFDTEWYKAFRLSSKIP